MTNTSCWIPRYKTSGVKIDCPPLSRRLQILDFWGCNFQERQPAPTTSQYLHFPPSANKRSKLLSQNPTFNDSTAKMSSTSAVSATYVLSAAVATSTACTGSLIYDIPVQDASCAVPFGGNHTDIMSQCCGSADVVSYDNNCGLYCLAIEQSVSDITSCLFDNGASYSDVFCRGTGNATASVTASDTLATGASIIASGSGSSANKTSDGTGSGSSTSRSNANAAPGVALLSGFSVMGFAVTGLVFSSVVFGALQL